MPSAHFAVYEEHLSKLQLGHPLWQPEPRRSGQDELEDEIQIGDIGVIREGTFYRILNVLKDRQHSDPTANESTGTTGLPGNAEPLALPKNTFNFQDAAIKKGPLFSRTIQSVDAQVETSSNASPNGTLHFRCKQDQGAILVLDHDAREEKVYMGRQATRYIKQHHDSWLEYAKSDDVFGLQDEDSLIFVSGVVKTGSSWSMAAITRDGKSATVKFGGGIFAPVTAGATIKWTKKTSILQRKWPPEQKPEERKSPLTYNHCVFLKYCKAKQIPFLGLHITANADPPRLLSTDQGEDGSTLVLVSGPSDKEVEEESYLPKTYDPLEYVLDYILKESDAKFAIASIDGFYEACQGDVPDDIEKFLQEKKPGVYVTDDGIGILLCEPEMRDALMAEDVGSPAMEGERSVIEAPHVAPPDIEQPSTGSTELSSLHSSSEIFEDVTEEERRASSAAHQGRSEDDPGEKEAKVLDKLVPFLEESGTRVILYNILAFSTNDTYLVGGGTDGSIKVWVSDTGDPVIKCVPSREGTTIIAYRSRSQQSQIAGPPSLGTVNTIEFSPVTEPVFVCGTDNGKAVWWNVVRKEWKLIGEGIHKGAVMNVKWSPDGNTIATMTMDSEIHLWSASSLQLLRSIDGGNNGSPHPLAFSPDSTRLLSANSQFCVQIWAIQTGQEIGCLRGHDGVIWSFAYSPDGKRLITGSDDGTARIWSAEKYESLIILAEMAEPVWHVEFTQDGERVCAGQTDGTIVVFDSWGGSKLCAIEGDSVDDASAACQPRADVSPDGTKVIVTSGPRVVLCDGMTGKTLGRVEQMDNICGAQFSHDGNRVATAAEDGIANIWDLETFSNENSSRFLVLAT